MMKISDVMSREVALVRPDQPIKDAAQLMFDLDVGILPVTDQDRLVGMITDRDIAVRAVGAGRGPDTPIRSVMSPDVCYCFDDQAINEVANNMADIQVRRLPVLDRDKRLVGIIAIADIARSSIADGSVETAVSGISAPGGYHTQSKNGLEARL